MLNRESLVPRRMPRMLVMGGLPVAARERGREFHGMVIGRNNASIIRFPNRPVKGLIHFLMAAHGGNVDQCALVGVTTNDPSDPMRKPVL
jgi:hypothetical protein